MELEDSVLRVQTAYPRIYLACHSRHQNARTNQLSQRDGALLAHLAETHPVAQTDLARHLGVAKSTLSEALTSLAERGLIIRESQAGDVRGAEIRRRRAGSLAMSNSSVLEPARLARILGMLTEDERQRAVDGMELIAKACERMMHVG
jgi:DNA-binding MarR family transcriptional regulator